MDLTEGPCAWRGEGWFAAALLEAIQDGIGLLDASGRLVDVNRALCEMTGFTRDELVGREAPYPHWPEEERATLEEARRRTLSGVPHESDLVFRRKSGERFPVIVKVAPLRDARGAVAGHVAIVKDVTERRRAQDETRRHLAAMAATMDGVAIHDAEGRFTWLNDAHARTYGYASPAELLGRSWRDLYEGAHRTHVETQVMPALRAKGRWRGEAVGRRKDGTEFPQELSLTTLPDGGLVCVVRDLSEARAAQAALRGAQERLQTFVAHAPVILFAVDREGRVTLSEGQGLRALGVRPGQNVGKRLVDLYPDAPQVHENIRRALAGETFTDVVPLRGLVFETRYAPVRDASGAVVGATGVATDVTERTQAQEALLHAQKLESLGMLAGGIAHDFNNLLVGVLGNASLVLLEVPPGTRLRRTVEKIEEAGQRAARLTRQLLAYAGRGKFATEALDPARLLREVAPLLQVGLGSGLALDLRVAAGLPAVEADAGQIQQALVNLVVHAAEAMEGRSGTVRVAVGLRTAGQRTPAGAVVVPGPLSGEAVVYEVSDSGPGIDPGLLPRLFEPFAGPRTPERGLALSVVLGIARAHRGAVEVETSPGSGTTFRLLLPRSAHPLPAEEPSAAHAPGPVRGVVLVIDDEPAVRDVACAMLERAGYTAVGAHDGAQGVEIFRRREREIVAVMLDLTMPRKHGQDALREIRALRPNVHVVLMSGFDEHGASRHPVGGPAVEFLRKPFTLAELSERLRGTAQAS